MEQYLYSGMNTNLTPQFYLFNIEEKENSFRGFISSPDYRQIQAHLEILADKGELSLKFIFNKETLPESCRKYIKN